MANRRRIRLVSFLAVLVGVTTLPAAVRAQDAGSTAVPADVAEGARIFSRNCQRCHQPRGPEEWSDREWVIILQHMETRANLTRRRAKAVREFLLASNGPAQAPGRLRAGLAMPGAGEITEEMISGGREVYTTTGGCAACHGGTLGGGPVAPSLADDKWRNGDGSFESILDVIRNGVSGTAMAPYPAGISDEMAIQVAAYVWAVSQGRIEP